MAVSLHMGTIPFHSGGISGIHSVFRAVCKHLVYRIPSESENQTANKNRP